MYNFISTFEELNKLYEEVDTKKAHEEELAEAADEEVEIEIEDDESSSEVEEAEESEEASEADEEAVEEEEPVEYQFVLECGKCGALSIKVAEEAGKVDMEEVCQFCEENDGYKILGTMIPFTVEEEAVAEEPVDGAEEIGEDEPVEEGLLNLDMPISANVNVKADGNSVPFMNTGI